MNNPVALEKILFGKTHIVTYGIGAFLMSILLIPVYSYFSALILLILITGINSLIVLSLVKNHHGLIPCSRYLFLIAPGYLQLFVYVVTAGQISVAILANNFITEDIITFVALISTVGAASANMGFILKPLSFTLSFPRKNISKGLTPLFLIFFILFALYYGNSLGKSLLDIKQYATNTEATKTVVGVINVFYFYFLALFFVYRFWLYDKFSFGDYNIYMVIILVIVGFVALRGVRQDSIGLVLAVFAISYARRFIRKDKSMYLFVLVLFFISWVGSTFTGALREDATASSLTGLFTKLPFIMFSKGYIIFNMNTASMTIGTLNVIPYKLIDTGYLYGESFLNWIPRTLPEFLLSNRPEGPEFAMHYNDIWFGWGGIHEVAEVFWNFSYLGVLFLPLIFSYLLNSLGKSFLRSGSFFMAIPVVWLIMMPRWIWYQIFALYKSTLTMFIIALLLFVLFDVKKKQLSAF